MEANRYQETHAVHPPGGEAVAKRRRHEEEGSPLENSEKRQRLRWISRREKIEVSVTQIMEELIREEALGIGWLCTREAIAEMVDMLDEASTRKAVRQLQKQNKKRSRTSCDWAGVHSGRLPNRS